MQVRSGDSSDTLGVESGKGARVALYRTDRLGALPYSGAELARGTVVATYERTSVSIAPVIFYALRNTSAARILRVHRILAFLYSSNVAGGTSTLKAQIDHYRNVTSVTAAAGAATSAQTPSIFKTALGAASGVESTLTDTVTNGGTLVMNGGVKLGEVGGFYASAQTLSATVMCDVGNPFLFLDAPAPLADPFDLAQNEALAFVQPLVAMGPGASLVITTFFSELAP